MPPSDELSEEIWVTLAELFFSEDEPSDSDFTHAATLLKQAGWSREETKKTLITLIAPYAGADMAFLSYPLIGLAGYNKEELCPSVRRSAALRKKHPQWWYFFISDWHYAKVLQSRNIDRLLNLL